MPRRFAASAWSALALGLTAGMAADAAAAPPAARTQCFLSRDWSDWKPSPDSKSIYIRVGVNRVFRLDLAAACPLLQTPGARLITKLHGSPWICHPLDLDLRVSDGHGIRTPCMVTAITPLTREQAAALPRDLRP